MSKVQANNFTEDTIVKILTLLDDLTCKELSEKTGQKINGVSNVYKDGVLIASSEIGYKY